MTTTTSVKTPADRAARLLTEAFAPAHLVIGLLLLIGAASHPSPARGLAWGALAGLLVGALPYTWVLHAARRGRLTSKHVPDRRQRLRPLGIATVTALTGLALLCMFGAPRQLVALVIAMLTGLTVTGVITHYWKISLHTAVAAGTATILTIVYGPVAVAGWPLYPPPDGPASTSANTHPHRSSPAHSSVPSSRPPSFCRCGDPCNDHPLASHGC